MKFEIVSYRLIYAQLTMLVLEATIISFMGAKCMQTFILLKLQRVSSVS